MLKNLSISNFALIEQVKVSFPSNLAIVTGETGAGKSIFLEALSLVLGARADVGVLLDRTKKCVVEAEFDLTNYKLKSFFEANELEYENLSILRREINPEGKSRAFINDSPVTLAVLKALTEKLVDIHSQHETLLLQENNFQFDVLDNVAGSYINYLNYKKQFTLYNQKLKELENLKEDEIQAKKDLDYYQFLFDELDEVNLKPGELKTLEEESDSLENAEYIKSNLLKAAAILSEDENNLLTSFALAKQQLAQLNKFGNTYNSLSEKANSLYLEIKELAGDILTAENSVAHNPNKLEELNLKLDKLNRLLKKHNVKTEEDLILAKAEIETKLRQFSSIEHLIDKVSKELSSLKKELLVIATELHKKRIDSISEFEKSIKEILHLLSMPNAQFKLELNQTSEFNSHGLNTLKFLFSANKGSDFKELHKVASGGELSRLMLSIKSILATKKSLPTIIFDEIDTGVSGDVADKIGHILVNMSARLQVISITHLPQIASKGKFHLFVYKSDTSDKTISYIKELNKEERVVEIAKMLSTGNPTASAIKNAKDLLSSN